MIQFDFEGYFLNNFPNARASGDNYSITCLNPTCEDQTKQSKNKMNVSLTKRVFYCFRCGISGNFIRFISLYERKPEEQVRAEIYEEQPARPTVDIDDFSKKVLDNVFGADAPIFDYTLELPSNCISADQHGTSLMYLNKRGVTTDQIKFYKIMLCLIGKYAWRLIIPVYELGKMVYYVGREFLDTGVPGNRKYLNPYKQGPLGKSNFVFNIDAIEVGSPMIITEGVFDAITVGTDAVCIFGKVASGEQVKKILAKKPDKIYVMLDGDAAVFAMTLCKRLEGRGAEVYFVELFGEEDPNILGNLACRDRINNSQLFNFKKFVEIMSA